MKAVFVGGHHNSALVVAKLMQEKGHQVFWLGHKHTMHREKSLSAEFLEVSKNKIPFWEIKTGKFYKNINLGEFVKIGSGILTSLKLLRKIKPDLVVAWGGYLSFPVVIAAFILKVPAVTHEQTTQSGLANKIISRFVRKVFLTWETSAAYFPKNKTEVVGLPLKKDFFDLSQDKIFNNKLPTVLIVGGKQGSHLINSLVEEDLEKLLAKYNLIHQSGNIQKTNDFNRLKLKKSRLKKELQQRYLLKTYFFGSEIVKVLKSADLVVSRSGAHIVNELLVLKKPAILIPISWSSANEQKQNALLLKERGLAEVLSESKVTAKILSRKIDFMVKNLSVYKKNISKFKNSMRQDAAFKMVNILEKEFAN